MTPPRLSGPRVALVPLGEGTTDPAGALAVTGLAAGVGWPHDDTAVTMAFSAACWLVVVDDAVVGECAWKGPPDADGAVEIAYGLATPARGQGIGTEAVALLAAWSEQRPGLRALTAEVLPGNEASRRLLRRLGFVERPGAHGRVLAVRGRLPVRGRHVC